MSWLEPTKLSIITNAHALSKSPVPFEDLEKMESPVESTSRSSSGDSYSRKRKASLVLSPSAILSMPGEVFSLDAHPDKLLLVDPKHADGSQSPPVAIPKGDTRYSANYDAMRESKRRYSEGSKRHHVRRASSQVRRFSWDERRRKNSPAAAAQNLSSAAEMFASTSTRLRRSATDIVLPHPIRLPSSSLTPNRSPPEIPLPSRHADTPSNLASGATLVHVQENLKIDTQSLFKGNSSTSILHPHGTAALTMSPIASPTSPEPGLIHHARANTGEGPSRPNNGRKKRARYASAPSSAAPARHRSSSSSSNNTSPRSPTGLCASCKQPLPPPPKTPPNSAKNKNRVRKRLPPAWGPNAELCMSCRARYAKKKLRCSKCFYIPDRKEEESKVCVRCRTGHWLNEKDRDE
ncbi:hypothetical protein BZG36_02158 [Bifiguratus adelaidae]|uniref:Uncharacterized protein n=1 Tax=Bifiguratus adelaidae TaxID=1938954 RepID=A0A261Y3F3_9FUNG|nr:hypothetical protein BZG36_02158 [Bifiguratus adelaidae]